MDKETFDKQQIEIAKKKKEHLKKVAQGAGKDKRYQICAHDLCESCCGTGITLKGRPCTHYISCQCPKCQPMLNSTAFRYERIKRRTKPII